MSFNINEEKIRLVGFSFAEIEQLIQAAQVERNQKKESEELVQLKAQALEIAQATSESLRDELKTMKDMLDASWLF